MNSILEKGISRSSLKSIRQECANNESSSQTTIYYQDSLIDFIVNNTEKGSNIIEIGCYKGGLTAQLSYCCEFYNIKLFVIDIEELNIEHTKKLLDKLNLRQPIFFNMNFQYFVQQNFYPEHTILTIIDADHSYYAAYKDFITYNYVSHKCYTLAFHDYGLCTASNNNGVNRALHKAYGKNVPIHFIGDSPNYVDTSLRTRHTATGKQSWFEKPEGGYIINNFKRL